MDFGKVPIVFPCVFGCGHDSSLRDRFSLARNSTWSNTSLAGVIPLSPIKPLF
jgi:hypothetical protein